MEEERYEKQKIIGRGSYGEAYLVKSKSNQKLYVMKTINLGKTQEKPNGWVQEIKILQACRHVNVIRYKECFFGQDNALNPSGTLLVHIVMEYADSGDLHAHIKRQKDEVKKDFVESQVRNWLVQLGFALQHLHKMRIMHRDLKPANVFMTTTKLLKLGDFGVSKVLDANTHFAQTQIGTPTHISPEVVLGKSYDFKSDIWGLGCIVYEICCQKPPFLSKNLNEIFEKIKNAKYADIPKTYSQTLSDLIRIMLKVEPKRRPTAYQLLTSGALKEDLDLYTQYVKTLPQGAGSSDGGSTSRSSSSIGSGEQISAESTSSGVFSGEIKPE